MVLRWPAPARECRQLLGGFATAACGDLERGRITHGKEKIALRAARQLLRQRDGEQRQHQRLDDDGAAAQSHDPIGHGRQAVQMLLDGHSVASVVERLGLSGPTLLYRWKQVLLASAGPAATSLEARVRELELELHRVERERDILKKALAIFGRHE